MNQQTLNYPQALSEKYRPAKISEFIGLQKPKAIMEAFARKPYSSAWVFLGESGIGKTSMALALASQLPAELHHIPSRSCDLETVEETARFCQYVPMNSLFHLVLVDEADQMTQAAQHAFLSKMDATAFPPNTIFIFTANSTHYLENRFLSRCRVLEFSTHNIGQELPSYLRKIWRKETGKRNGVNFNAMSEESTRNVRDALMKLEMEIMAGGIPEEPKDELPKKSTSPPQSIYHERARKAVETRNRKIRAEVEAEIKNGKRAGKRGKK